MKLNFLVLSGFVLGQVLLAPASPAQDFDPDMAWPLCGRIAENPPVGWIDSDGCPAERWGSVDHTDLPLNSPFGPRPLNSENDRYDFHRGIDISTPVMTPVFAIAEGIVRIAGNHSSYSDPLVQIRHYRPGHTSCSEVGCYHSNYMHLTSAVVNIDEPVSKGDLVGYTGESGSGFAHLHFEIRDAPPNDPTSSWQRDAITALGVLPYQSPDTAQIVFDSVDTSDPANPVVQVTVTLSRVDVNRVELFVYDEVYAPVPQPGNTPDARGYNVYPSWFDMDEWNRQYSHKDSTNFPWESYGAGGENECPFYLDHGPSYSAHVHLDAADPADFQVGLFNGLRIQTLDYTPGNYALTLTFNELQGPAHCILGKVELAAGGSATKSWGDCSGVLPLADDQSVETEVNLPVDITLTGTGTNLTYEITRWPLDGILIGTPPDVTYTPGFDFTGIDSFDFVVDDGFATSNVATVTVTVNDTADPGVPADPANVTAANASRANGTAMIGWTHDGANVTAFEIRREKQNKRGAWKGLTTIATVSAGTNSHVDPSGDGTFRYQVRALNGSQSSNWMPAQWAEVTVTTASGGGGGGDGSINCSKKQNRDLPECNGG